MNTSPPVELKMLGDIIITSYDVGFDHWVYTAIITNAWVSYPPQLGGRIYLNDFTITEEQSFDDPVKWLRSLEHQGLKECVDQQQLPMPFEHDENRIKGLFILPSGELRLLPLTLATTYPDLPFIL